MDDSVKKKVEELVLYSGLIAFSAEDGYQFHVAGEEEIAYKLIDGLTSLIHSQRKEARQDFAKELESSLKLNVSMAPGTGTPEGQYVYKILPKLIDNLLAIESSKDTGEE